MSTGKVLLFFPHIPFPASTGAHKRFLEIAAGFADLGCEVTLVSSKLTSETPRGSDFDSSRPEWVKDVLLHEPTRLDSLLLNAGKLASKVLARSSVGRSRPLDILDNPVNLRAWCPPSLKKYFDSILQEREPDIILISYALWDGLLDHDKYRSRVRVMDSLDLLTLNQKMRHVLVHSFPPNLADPSQVSDEVLSEDYFDRMNLTVSPTEFRIYDRYDYTLAISKKEAELISANTTHTRVVFVSMTQEVPPITNTYGGPALYCAAYNLFNVQGYFYFLKKVMPKLKNKAPSFNLVVTGGACEHLPPSAAVQLAGYVPNLQQVYSKASFAVCPLIGGTGQ